MNKYISFDVESAEIVEENPDSQFATAKIQAFSTGKNKHDMVCSEDVLKKTAPTIYNKPILYSIDNMLDDFYTHVEPEKSLIAGFVVPESGEFVKLPDSRISLTVFAKIWKRYAPKVIEFFKRSSSLNKKVSVEMELYDSEKRSDEFTEMLDFAYAGITLLGDFVTEASPGANMQLLSFSQENEEYKNAKELEFGDNNNLLTFPYKNMKDVNPALKGIEPPISLSQANAIARQADAIGSDEEKSGWAIAIASFKKTHVVKDGKWVEKSEKKEEMSVNEEERQKLEEEEKAKKEQLALDEEKKKKEEQMAFEESEKAKKAEEEQKAKEEQMALDEENKKKEEFSATLALFEGEPEIHQEMASEFAKPYAEMNYAKVMSAMYAKICKMAEQCKNMEAMELAMAKKDEELKVYMAKCEELSKFKADKEQEQFNFAVDSTLKEIEEKTKITLDELEVLREEAKNYNLETFSAWSNLAKARGFEFAAKETGGNEVIRYGLPFPADTRRTNSPWIR